jgi:signal peptidase I
VTARVPDSQRFIHVLEELLSGGHPVRFRAPGWSMHPTIRNGDAITVVPLGQSPVRVGDVVLYRRGPAAIAHRVIRLQSAYGRSVGLVLRGDAAHSCDRPIHVAQVLGRVLSVERDGRRMHLDPMGPSWSRVFGLALRVVRDARTRSSQYR